MSEIGPHAQKPRSFRTWRTITALIIREMSTTYGKTAFGYLWAIFEPAAGIMLLTFVFTIALRTPSLGTNFPLFYASGLLPFLGFLDVSNKVAQSLKFSRPLLAFPAVTFVDPIIARALLNSMTQILVMVLVVSFIIIAYQIDVILRIEHLIGSVVMFMALSLGIGTFNCFMFMKYHFWERVWSVITRPLLFVSAIFYLIESVPEPFHSILLWNPLVHVVGEFRHGIYITYEASYVSFLYVYGISLVSLVVGLLMLKKHYRDLLHK